MPYTSLLLSVELFLIYVLRASGCHGRMTTGRIERTHPHKINIYDEHDTWLEYFSGDALRTWCVLNQNGMPHEDWKSIHPLDIEHVAACAIQQRAT